MSPAGQLPGSIAVPGVPATAAEMAIVGFIIIVGLYFGQVVWCRWRSLSFYRSYLRRSCVSSSGRGLPNTPAVVLVVAVAFCAHLRRRRAHHPTGQQPGAGAAALSDHPQREGLRVARSHGGRRRRPQASQRALKDLQQQLEAPAKSAAPPVAVTVTPLQGSPNTGDNGNARPIPVEVHTPAPTSLDQLQSIIGLVLHPLGDDRRRAAVCPLPAAAARGRARPRHPLARLARPREVDHRDGRRRRPPQPLLPRHDRHQCGLRHRHRRAAYG